MQTASISNSSSFSTVSVLKEANKQPQLAGELISKTVESLMQTTSAQAAAQPVHISAMSESGTLINIRA